MENTKVVQKARYGCEGQLDSIIVFHVSYRCSKIVASPHENYADALFPIVLDNVCGSKVVQSGDTVACSDSSIGPSIPANTARRFLEVRVLDVTED